MPVISKVQNAAVPRIKSYLAELRGLSPADLQAVSISLEAALTSASAPGTDQYKAPGDMDFFAFQVHGYVRMPTLNSEPSAILGWLNLPPSERWLVKAQNCLVGLLNQDKNHKFFDGNQDLELAAIMPPMGIPLVFPPEAPMVLNSGSTIKATFTLQDSTTAIIGNSTKYGVVLTGVLVPKRES